MQSNQISLVSLVAGAVLFFLPWIEVQCQGHGFIRQSGLQIATGGASLAPDLAQGRQAQNSNGGDGEKGLIVGAAGVLTLLALWSAWLAWRDGRDEPEKAGRLAAVALALVVSQPILGFPVERRLSDEMKIGRAHV